MDLPVTEEKKETCMDESEWSNNNSGLTALSKLSGKGKVRWQPLESNPEVFTNFAQTLLTPPGFPELMPSPIRFVDIISTDDWALEMIPEPVLAVILLFPTGGERMENMLIETIKQSDARVSANESLQQTLNKIWFTEQSVSNACGAVALLHVLMNCALRGAIEFPEGCILSEFKQQTEGLNPKERAMLLERFAPLANAHKRYSSCGDTQPIGSDKSVAEHFTVLMPFDNEVVELDGRRTRPFFVRSLPVVSPSESFCRIAVNHIAQAYFNATEQSECLRFCLMAAVASR